jgi:hypothetical protein
MGMTSVAMLGTRPVPCPVVTPPGTPHRNVRVHEDDWKPFGRNVGDRNRSSWINEFIGMVNRDARLWHDAKRIARLRGETLEGIVITALRRYVARNRDLLGDSEDE